MLFRSLEDIPHVASFHCMRGTVLKRLGRFGEAQIDLNQTADMLEEIDDKLLETIHWHACAGLQQFIGNYDEALTLAKKSAAQAEDQQDNPNLLNALILISKLTDDDSVINRGLELAQELNMERERILIEANRLSHLLPSSPDETLSQFQQTIQPHLEKMHEDVEQAGLLALAGRIYSTNGLIKEARDLALRAESAANRCGLVPELVDILALQAQVALSLGEYEESFAAAKKGLNAAKQVALSLSDVSRRTCYQSRPEIKLLVDQINGLKTKIAQKR